MIQMSITVRPAAIEDADLIFSFVCALEEDHFHRDTFHQLYRGNIQNKDYCYRVAVDCTGKIIGYISCHSQVLLHHGGKACEVQEFFVDESYRNRGVGRQLMLAVEAYAWAEQARVFEVTVNLKRKRAVEFYLSSGFALTHIKLVKHPPVY